jgi:hypothetical protein
LMTMSKPMHDNSSTASAIKQLPEILYFHARQENVFDTSSDTVIVTRALLNSAAQEIETLRNFLDGIQKMANLARLADDVEETPSPSPEASQRGSQS